MDWLASLGEFVLYEVTHESVGAEAAIKHLSDPITVGEDRAKEELIANTVRLSR